MTREEFEAALDAGTLEIHPDPFSPRWYKVRRNGRTQVRASGAFRVPIKWAFNNTEQVSGRNFLEPGLIDRWFRVASDKKD